MNDLQGSSGAGGKKEEANRLPSDILQELRIRKLEPLQRVGLWLALAFFGYIIVASGAIFFVSFRWLQLPSPPTSPSNPGDIEQYKRLLDAYKQSADIYQQMAKLQVERATQLFQLVVASTILPVFSAILGYIFGSKRSGE